MNWKSLAKRLGDGSSGFLSYLYRTCKVEYKRYPHGVSQEFSADKK